MNETEATDDLLRERNFWQLYLATWRAPFPWRALLPSCLVAIGLISYILSASPGPAQIAQQVRELSEFGFQLSVAMLGFLVAGFTIFATITKPSLFRNMLAQKHRETGYSWLKWTFVMFMHVFAHFIGFLFLALLVKAFGTEGGALAHFVSKYSACATQTKTLMASLALVVIAWWATYLLVLLGQFVHNIYQVCAVMVITEIEGL